MALDEQWGSTGHTVFFTLLNFFVYFERGLANGFLPRLLTFFGRNQKDGGLLNSLGIAGFTLGAPLAGPLSRLASSSVLLMGVANLFMSAGALWMGFNIYPELFGQVIASRFFNGLGEAWFATLAPPILDDIAPSESKALTIGVYFTAIPLGMAFGMGFTFPFTTWTAGRVGFVATGIFWAIFGIYFLARPKHFCNSAQRADEPSTEFRERHSFTASRSSFISKTIKRDGNSDLRKTLTSFQWWILSLAYAGHTWFLGGVSVWVNQYIEVVYDIKGTIVVGILTLVAALIGSSLGGHLVDVFSRKMGRLEACSMLNTIFMVMCIPFALAAPLCQSVLLFFACVFVGMFLCLLSLTPINIALMESVPLEARGLALGLATFVMHALGDVPSSLIYGALADKTTNDSIDAANFDTNGLKQDLFERECTRDKIHIYMKSATLDNLSMSYIEDNEHLLELVDKLGPACLRTTTCVEYGQLLRLSCGQGQVRGMLFLDVGICVAAVLFAISWLTLRRSKARESTASTIGLSMVDMSTASH